LTVGTFFVILDVLINIEFNMRSSRSRRYQDSESDVSGSEPLPGRADAGRSIQKVCDKLEQCMVDFGNAIVSEFDISWKWYYGSEKNNDFYCTKFARLEYLVLSPFEQIYKLIWVGYTERFGTQYGSISRATQALADETKRDVNRRIKDLIPLYTPISKNSCKKLLKSIEECYGLFQKKLVASVAGMVPNVPVQEIKQRVEITLKQSFTQHVQAIESWNAERVRSEQEDTQYSKDWCDAGAQKDKIQRNMKKLFTKLEREIMQQYYPDLKLYQWYKFCQESEWYQWYTVEEQLKDAHTKFNSIAREQRETLNLLKKTCTEQCVHILESLRSTVPRYTSRIRQDFSDEAIQRASEFLQQIDRAIAQADLYESISTIQEISRVYSLKTPLWDALSQYRDGVVGILTSLVALVREQESNLGHPVGEVFAKLSASIQWFFEIHDVEELANSMQEGKEVIGISMVDLQRQYVKAVLQSLHRRRDDISEEGHSVAPEEEHNDTFEGRHDYAPNEECDHEI